MKSSLLIISLMAQYFGCMCHFFSSIKKSPLDFSRREAGCIPQGPKENTVQSHWKIIVKSLSTEMWLMLKEIKYNCVHFGSTYSKNWNDTENISMAPEQV